MKICKKCGSEFEQKIGLINYCSLSCRNSRTWKDEDKQKKADALKVVLSEEQIKEIEETFDIFKTIQGTARALNLSSRLIRRNLDYIKPVGNTKAQHVGAWLKRTKQYLVKYKGGKCEIETCGYDKCIDALEFHHRDPNKKDFGIGGSTKSIEKLKAEVDKCIMVCANCHREIHAELNKQSKNFI